MPGCLGSVLLAPAPPLPGADNSIAWVLSRAEAEVQSQLRLRTEAHKQEAQRSLKQFQREEEALADKTDKLQATRAMADDARRLRIEASLVKQALSVVQPAKSESAAELLQVRQRLCQQEADLNELAASTEAQLAAKAELHAEQDTEVELLLALFSNRMGLTIRPAGPKTVSLVYSLLDPSDPEREFVATVGLCSSGYYEEVSCFPPLKIMPELLRELNDAPHHIQAAFPHFVCSLRRAFQEACR